MKLFSKTLAVFLSFFLQVLWFVLLYQHMDNYVFLFIFGLNIFTFLLVLFVFQRKVPTETKLSWIILILLFPIGGSLIYFWTHSSKKVLEISKKLVDEEVFQQKYQLDNREVLEEVIGQDRVIFSQMQYFDRVGFSIYGKCQTDYYPFGKKAYDEMLKVMKKAKKFIFLEYFIIRESGMWNEILEVLQEKALEGVEVRILYDDIGSAFKLKKNYVKELSVKGIQMLSIYPKMTFFDVFSDNRNHRKTLVIDGEVAFTGGINIASECLGETDKYGLWKDSSIRVRGEAVFEFTKMFLLMWNAIVKANANHLQQYSIDEDYEIYRAEAQSYLEDGYLIPYGHSPFNDEVVASRVYLNMINQATKFLYIYTPYLILDTPFKVALMLAAKRGVEIKIVTPGIPDKKLVYQVTRSNYPELLEVGVQIYEYKPGFLHAKCVISDDLVATSLGRLILIIVVCIRILRMVVIFMEELLFKR